jgi:hypothetical protein
MATSSSACTTSTAAPASGTYTLSGSQQTVELPTYNVYSGTSIIPYNNEEGGTLTYEVSQNNFDGAPTSTTSEAAYATRTKDLYFTLSVGQLTTFYNESNHTTTANVTVYFSETSPCITPGKIYYLDVFQSGTFESETSTPSESTATNGAGTVNNENFDFTINPVFPNTTLDIVMSH